MEALLNESIDPKDIIEYEKKYKKEVALGVVTDNVKFEYAWCLTRSSYSSDWKDGYCLMKELYHSTKDEQVQKCNLKYAPAALMDADFGPLEIRIQQGAGQYCSITIRYDCE